MACSQTRVLKISLFADVTLGPKKCRRGAIFPIRITGQPVGRQVTRGFRIVGRPLCTKKTMRTTNNPLARPNGQGSGPEYPHTGFKAFIV